jgi:hypothetical protein
MVCQAGRQPEKLVESLAIASSLDENVMESSVGILGFWSVRCAELLSLVHAAAQSSRNWSAKGLRADFGFG